MSASYTSVPATQGNIFGDAKAIARLLKNVAFWQGMMFLMLVCVVWVIEVLDLARIIYGVSPSGIDWFGAGLVSAGIVLVGFITVAHTYLLQQRILKGIIVACSYCNKVRVEETAWQDLEHYVSERTRATFSHGVCPNCFGKVNQEIDEHAFEPLDLNAFKRTEVSAAGAACPLAPDVSRTA